MTVARIAMTQMANATSIGTVSFYKVETDWEQIIWLGSPSYLNIRVLQCLVVTVESPLCCDVSKEMEVGEEEAHHDDTTPDNDILIRAIKYL